MRSAEGRNHQEQWYAPVQNLSIDSRVGGGPVWSPDGTKMAAIYEGLLTVFPVTKDGEPVGPPRRLTSEMAYNPSWSGDSRHILYQSMDHVRVIDIETGQITDVPIDLTYTVDVPSTTYVVYAESVGGRHEQHGEAERRHRDRGQSHPERGPALGRVHAGMKVIDASEPHGDAGTHRVSLTSAARSR